jgi:hypothetical protein
LAEQEKKERTGNDTTSTNVSTLKHLLFGGRQAQSLEFGRSLIRQRTIHCESSLRPGEQIAAVDSIYYEEVERVSIGLPTRPYTTMPIRIAMPAPLSRKGTPWMTL